MNIIDIANQIGDKIGIDKNELLTLINGKLTPEEIALSQHNDKIEQIQKLLTADEDINNFGNRIENQNVKDNYNKLKNNLGKLQVLILTKKIKKSKDCDDILNSFIEIFDNKVKAVNNILEKKLDIQTGGDYYVGKYIKYKMKYMKLKYLNL